MPKVSRKTLKSHREPQFYRLKRSVSEPSVVSKSDREGNSTQTRISNFLAPFVEEEKLRRLQLEEKLRDLNKKYASLKKKYNDEIKMECAVCYSTIGKESAVCMGDCGHGACKSCFVTAVASSAIQLRQHNEVDTISQNGVLRCFVCRELNYSFTESLRGTRLVRYVNYGSRLQDQIDQEYQRLLASLNLPPLPQTSLYDDFIGAPAAREAANDGEEFQEGVELGVDANNGEVQESVEESQAVEEDPPMESGEVEDELSGMEVNPVPAATSSEESLLESASGEEDSRYKAFLRALIKFLEEMDAGEHDN